jgi:hypothetical protein
MLHKEGNSLKFTKNFEVLPLAKGNISLPSPMDLILVCHGY